MTEILLLFAPLLIIIFGIFSLNFYFDKGVFNSEREAEEKLNLVTGSALEKANGYKYRIRTPQGQFYTDDYNVKNKSIRFISHGWLKHIQLDFYRLGRREGYMFNEQQTKMIATNFTIIEQGPAQ